ncbi:MAG: EAL domain-containing protein, partial [Pseudomonadota bacterium]
NIVNRIVGNTDALENILDRSETDELKTILNIVKDQTGYNFYSYRESTIKRRIARRMSICGIADIHDYKSFIVDNKEELDTFVRDAFIIVSEFYRDTKEFDVLQKHLQKILDTHRIDQQFRVWVPGCASGEEAYTIAMMIEDLKKTGAYNFDIKVMATDISADAIADARQGVFDIDKITNLPEAWKKTYCEVKGDTITVKSNIREKILFSVHNIFVDPPFSKINLISCRNLLIYFNKNLQKKIIELFHFSLQRQGLLFLGPSEAIREKELFDAVDASVKLYSRVDGISKTLLQTSKHLGFPVTVNSYKEKRSDDIEKKIIKSIVDFYAPAVIVANQDNKIVYTSGNFSPLLSKEGVFFKDDIFDLLNPSLRASCRAMSFRVRRTQEKTPPINFDVTINGEPFEASVYVSVLNNELPDWILISYVVKKSQSNLYLELNSLENNEYIDEIEKELSATRENLQTVIEELETTNEQLQVYNEELQSTNEEYQSTNEELQTVNEELQSTNEELITTNEEYSQKTLEQAQLSADLSNIQESLKIPVFVIDTEYRIQRFTESCSSIIDTHKLKVNDLFFALHWYSDIPDLKQLLDIVEQEKLPKKTQITVSDRNYDCQVSPYKNANDAFDGYTIIFYETTGLRKSQEALAREKLIAQTTLHNIIEGVIRIRADQTIEYANPAALSILERELDDLIDKDISKRLLLFEDNNDKVDLQGWIKRCTSDKVENLSPVILKTQYGKDVFVDLTISPLKDIASYVITIRDVSEKQAQIKRLEWQSQHDSLTGLVNRSEMEKRLERTILSSKRENTESSLLYMDLDQFKVINDTCGHLAGDHLLQQLSQLLMEVIRSRDTLARLGGDEFALLLDKCHLSDAESIAAKVQKKICDYRFVWKERVFRVGVSIGIVSINKEVNQVAEILSDADAACYAAKEKGRNAIQVHSKDDELLEKQRSEMHRISDINQAIDEDKFKLYFQDIRTIDDNRIETWEVLLRMFNDKGEFLTPTGFLPAAERFGLIVRIDNWVLENTIKNICGYVSPSDSSAFPRVSINISGYTLTDPEYINRLSTLLTHYAYPAANITFEITETAAISNLLKAKEFIACAREIGCNFALDDFGTGMSSLSYLRDLPLDYLKIDASFIRNVVTDDIDSALVKSVTDVAHRLSLKVIAEGVEDQSQHQHLRDLGIDCVQGFYVSKPRPFEEFIAEVGITE